MSVIPFVTGGDSHCVFPCRRMTNSLFPAEISVFLTGFLCKAKEGKPEMSVSPEKAAATHFHYLYHVWKRDLSLHGQRPHVVNQGLRPWQRLRLLPDWLQFLVLPQLQPQALKGVQTPWEPIKASIWQSLVWPHPPHCLQMTVFIF